ncbi:MAG: ABC transporter permease subunit [Kineosporiaceae bacterium]
MSAVTAPSGGLRARRRRVLQVWRVVVLLVLGSFFVVPLLALFEFSTRGVGEGAPRTMDAWRRIVSDTTLVGAILSSLELAVLTSVVALVLMVPTMIWVRLRLPHLSRVVEFICLLPLTIPAIVLVVGLGPVYEWVAYLTRTDSILTLFFAYVVLVLPYVYRSLDTGLAAIDVRTLSEAARSLGASWFDVIVKVVVPNMAAAVLNSALLCVAIVMGEYTIASLLNYVNLQVAIQQLGLADASMSMAVSLAALIFAFVLLVLLSFVGRRGRRTGRSS